ncbi:hypothetical protein EVAR_62701_1 [Eumeta japonica]|uniref:Uncharacterized protein n=1 Tax=Eumeta variegata TaxID=151549 RepID=A0A4C1ZKE0_EUMVA|nr:hypothetical protein EVAR_62701_1 [Eumeta japonica]
MPIFDTSVVNICEYRPRWRTVRTNYIELQDASCLFCRCRRSGDVRTDDLEWQVVRRRCRRRMADMSATGGRVRTSKNLYCGSRLVVKVVKVGYRDLFGLVHEGPNSYRSYGDAR